MKLQNLVHILIWIVCVVLLPQVQAVSPPPDGGYPGFNTAEGQKALFSLTSGTGNVAVGWDALYSDTQGSLNTAIGTGALLLNIGDQNTATGAGALLFNNLGIYNTANGAFALHLNTEGDFNTANGFQALFSNTTGIENTATGYQALFSNTTGNNNTAVGAHALEANTTGAPNTAIGFAALRNNTTGNGNTALGAFSGGAITTAHDVICIGPNLAGANISNSCFIDKIWNQDGGMQAVYVNQFGKLGAMVSSRRFKDEIKPMEQSSEAIYQLKPVSFRYKQEIEPTRPTSFGLIAEDVNAVNPDLVLPDKEGKPYTVRYDAVNAMLLNEFLKEHREVAELKSTVAEQRKGMKALAAQLKEQSAQIQKVSAQLEASKPAPQSSRTIVERTDAHRGDGKRFVVRGDDKLTAFLELETAIRIK